MSETSSSQSPSKGLIVSSPSKLPVARPGIGPRKTGQSHQAIGVQFVLSAIRQWWKVAAPIGLVLAATAGWLVHVFSEPQYEARALLEIKEETPYLAFEDRDNWQRFVGTQVELIRSPAVLGPVVGRAEIASVPELEREEDPVEWLRKEVQVRLIRGSELLAISFASSDPEDAQNVVNAVTEEYLNLQKGDVNDQAQRVIDLLEQEKAERLLPTGPIQRARDEVRRLTKEATGKDPFAVSPDADSPGNYRLADPRGRLTEAEVEREVLKARIGSLEDSFVWLGIAGTTSGGGAAIVRPPGDDNDLVIKPTLPGTESEDVHINFTTAQADNAVVTFDDAKPTPTLTVAIDPKNTTANTVIAEINKLGTFTAELDTTLDRFNDGTGPLGSNALDIIPATGPAKSASASITLPGEDNDLVITATKLGPAFANVDIVFLAKTVVGDEAVVTFDHVEGTLTIEIDPAGTTANTVVTALKNEGTFRAELDTTLDRNNDGTGLISRRQVKVPDGMVERTVREDVEVQRLTALLSAKRSKLREIERKSKNGKGDTSYQLLEKGISRDEETLEAVRVDLRQQNKAEMQPAFVNAREDQLAYMIAELEDHRVKERALRERYEKQLRDLKEYSGETLELVFARAELDRAEEVLKAIENRITALRTEKQAPSRARLRLAAARPIVPQRPWKQMTLVALAGLCLPFGLAVLWERIVRRVSDPEHLEQQSNLAVVGEIARFPARTRIAQRPSSKRSGREMMVFEESIDSLRTSLILSESLKDMRVLVVTSAANHEGKTSVAAQLAVSIARASGEQTLLIDGDMRSPDIHNVFDIPLEPGLAGVLAQECTLEDAIVTSFSDYVHLIPAGKLRASPHKLLGNGAVQPLLDKVLATYRYIIIDTPPVLAASESLVLAKAADASLICTMRDVSRLDQVRRACERLAAAGGRPVGTVLVGVPPKRYAYRYGSYAYPRD